ncbi:HNH endonuclease signature motif containing protein, partial [Antrihabitans sp. YC2-6]|uniref:HNH endonuclease signature motif containing protein n=1 Tax=Antrihabitans sp. YC2-6 TaxID=2799498 RepID=UPI0018F57930
ATKERHVWIGTGQDGMADVSGSLPAADAVFLSGRIGELAKGVCKQDPRTFAARRADALIALSRGDTHLACLCGRTECHAVTGQSKVARKALVHVIATRATVDGTSEQPGWLDGFGIIDADQARDIADTATIRPLLDPDGAAAARNTAAAGVTPIDRTDAVDARGSYRPSENQQDYVRALWGSCMFPNCDVPAWDCDIDHNKAYNHVNPAEGGQTAVENLGPFCRKHHRGKTFGGWELIRHEDGTLTITSPLGMTYPVAATGPIPLLGGTEPTRPDTEQVPDPKTRTRSEQHAARIRSERAHNAGDDEPPPF